jgi:hypothetical protein
MKATQVQNMRWGWSLPAHVTEHGPMTEPRPVDTPLDAVLQGKPSADEIPIAAWWFVAEALRHSVLVRRTVEGVATLPDPVFRLEASRARMAAEAALEELVDEVSMATTLENSNTGNKYSPTIPTIRATIYDLARLVVSPRSTPTVTLKAAIVAHLQALQVAAR